MQILNSTGRTSIDLLKFQICVFVDISQGSLRKIYGQINYIIDCWCVWANLNLMVCWRSVQNMVCHIINKIWCHTKQKYLNLHDRKYQQMVTLTSNLFRTTITTTTNLIGSSTKILKNKMTKTSGKYIQYDMEFLKP